MSAEMKRAVVRASSLQATGSAFMHGSQTGLGTAFDTRGEAVMPLLSHEMAIAQLPPPYDTSPVLRDLQLTPRNNTGVQVMDALTATIIELPVNEWLQRFGNISDLDGDLTRSLGPIITSLLSLVLPDKLTDEIIDIIVKAISFANPQEAVFLKEHYLPVFRNATQKLRESMGPLKKIEVAKTGIGGFTKFIYYTLWQEQIMKAKILLNPWVNEAGSALMPKIFALADKLSGFMNTDSAVQRCGDDVYPGAGWCRKKIAHPKSHEIAANAFYDLVEVGDYLGGLYQTESYELAAFEAKARASDPFNYEAQVMALEAATEVVAEVVRSVAAVMEKDGRGDAQWIVPDDSSFWKVVAAGALVLLGLALVVMAALFCKLRELQCTQRRAEHVESGAYAKLVEVPRF